MTNSRNGFNVLFLVEIDMWSVGCILGEMINRKPMFPGSDFIDQLTRVFKIIPIPETSERTYAIEKDALKFIKTLPSTPEGSLHERCSAGSPLAIDLLTKLLVFNPSERLTVHQALQHPYFDGVEEEWGDIPTVSVRVKLLVVL